MPPRPLEWLLERGGQSSSGLLGKMRGAGSSRRKPPALTARERAVRRRQRIGFPLNEPARQASDGTLRFSGRAASIRRVHSLVACRGLTPVSQRSRGRTRRGWEAGGARLPGRLGQAHAAGAGAHPVHPRDRVSATVHRLPARRRPRHAHGDLAWDGFGWACPDLDRCTTSRRSSRGRSSSACPVPRPVPRRQRRHLLLHGRRRGRGLGPRLRRTVPRRRLPVAVLRSLAGEYVR